MFVRIPKVLSEEQLNTIRASLDSAEAPWVDGRATAGFQGAPVKNNQQLDEASAMARELGQSIVAQLERNALFVSAVLPNRVYPPMFNRYRLGMSFGTHVDGTVRSVPGSAHKLRTDLSATLFIAAPESYDGGELIVESDFGQRNAKLAAGDMVDASLSAAIPVLDEFIASKLTICISPDPFSVASIPDNVPNALLKISIVAPAEVTEIPPLCTVDVWSSCRTVKSVAAMSDDWMLIPLPVMVAPTG